MIVYMAVTGDELELPLFLSESKDEMANWLGVKPRSVSAMASPSRQKRRKNVKNIPFRLVRVELEDEGGNINDPV